MDVFILELNRDLGIGYANKRLRDLIGFKSKELYGMKLIDLLDERIKYRYLEKALEASKDNFISNLFVKIGNKNNEYIWVNLTIQYVEPKYVVKVEKASSFKSDEIEAAFLKMLESGDPEFESEYSSKSPIEHI